MGHQSLYRRYRSQNFAEIKGQAHITTALRTAVAEGRYGHAYLFSGPRGTGKTSTARVLAKALNCENLTDGEPCGECKSCVDIQNGVSFDLHELDAASNNKVDDIRTLIEGVKMGTNGRMKVYILDEVHMLTPGAENALLKTLEEPPEHVVFVLATTEPHKVVPTIRSRTQHFEFHLLPGEDLEAHLRFVIADAGLDIGEDGIEYALRQGGGSARDTLSALDLVAAAGGVPTGSDIGVELSLAIGDGDAPASIAAVERAIESGREPRIIGETTVETLRHAFLSSMGAPLNQLSGNARSAASDLAGALGPATITRALEMLGQALIDMRQAPDPRVPLEVALLRLARRDGADTAGLLQRIEQLETQVAALASGAVSSVPHPATAAPADSPASTPAPAPAATPVPEAALTETAPVETAPVETAPVEAKPAATDAPPPPARRRSTPDPEPATGRPADQARASLTEQLEAPKPPPPAPAAAATTSQPEPQQQPPSQPSSVGPSTPFTLDALTAALDAGLLEAVSQRARVRFAAASPVGAEGATATFSVPNNYYLPRCEEVQGEIEQALSQHFGRPTTVAIVVDPNTGEQRAGQTRPRAESRERSTPSPATPSQPALQAEETDDDIDLTDLEDATDVAGSGIERLTQAFPGSQVIESFD